MNKFFLLLKLNKTFGLLETSKHFVFKRNLIIQDYIERIAVFKKFHYFNASSLSSIFNENSHSLIQVPDFAAMHQSIEIRSPFMDTDLLSASLGISPMDKICSENGVYYEKQIMRDAVGAWYGALPLTRGKMGFGYSLSENHLFKNIWRLEIDNLVSDFRGIPNVLSKVDLTRIWTDYKDDKINKSELQRAHKQMVFT